MRHRLDEDEPVVARERLHEVDDPLAHIDTVTLNSEKKCIEADCVRNRHADNKLCGRCYQLRLSKIYRSPTARAWRDLWKEREHDANDSGLRGV